MIAPVSLPASCSVEALAEWLNPFWAPSATIFRESEAMARAVRALVEAKVREAVELTRADASASCECDGSGLGSAFIDWDHSDATLVSRVLGAP